MGRKRLFAETAMASDSDSPSKRTRSQTKVVILRRSLVDSVVDQLNGACGLKKDVRVRIRFPVGVATNPASRSTIHQVRDATSYPVAIFARSVSPFLFFSSFLTFMRSMLALRPSTLHLRESAILEST
jgi:hypothetical protein